MPQGTKIATCCYCGTRAALVLSGITRHELACAACGAPLHHLKALRLDKAGDRETRPFPKPSRVASQKPARKQKPKRGKRRKRLMSKLFEDAFDVIEDLFD